MRETKRKDAKMQRPADGKHQGGSQELQERQFEQRLTKTLLHGNRKGQPQKEVINGI